MCTLRLRSPLDHSPPTMPLDFARMEAWRPGEPQITVVDAHTEGEPLRVIVSGFPSLKGNTILERRRELMQYHDALRTALMWEPRGHADMYGCLITPPVTPGADFGVLFMHNEGYSTMCGHGIIAVTKVALETGLLYRPGPSPRVQIDTPAGLVTAWAEWSGNTVRSVRFRNVPSFAYALDQSVSVTDLGTVAYDLAFGGAFYAYVRASDVGLVCVPDQFADLVWAGIAIKRAIMAPVPIDHPYEPDLGFLYGTIFTEPGFRVGSHSRNVCVFAEGEVDRSPTGTGVSGRAALLYLRGEIGLDEPIVIESIIGSRFTVRAAKETAFSRYRAIIPEVEGRAFITGRNTFWMDPRDPFKDGFILR